MPSRKWLTWLPTPEGPQGTSARRSRACACATAASRPSCGSSPTHCWRASSTRCRSASRTGRRRPTSWTRTTRKSTNEPGMRSKRSRRTRSSCKRRRAKSYLVSQMSVPPAAPPVLVAFVCLPQLRAIGRNLSRPRRSKEGGRSTREGPGAQSPWDPWGPWPGMSPGPLLGKGDLQPQLDSALQDVNDMYLLLEETEKQAVRRALIEERGRFCTFITFLQPVVNGELTMLGEITHLQGIIDDLVVLTAEPHKLPPASEQVIKDLKGSDYSWSYQTPPSSPSSSSSRKSSMCSAPSSSSSAKGGGAPWPGGAQTYSPSSTCRYRSLAQPATTTTRLSSVSSHDSGFVSQDATYSKPPSPMPSDITSQKSSSSASSEASETCQSVSECSSPTSDWSKVGSHEQPSGATLQRRKDRVELLRDTEPGPATIAAKHSEEVSPAASDLAMVLTRGLSLEHQKSSRDSLQYSSGYSTQTTTPSCSEDTIPSQGSDYDCYSVNGDADSEGPPEFDKSSTIPRNSNIAQNYRRLIQTKRPASTAGLPTATGLPSGAPPGVATIRRTPSTKPTVRRALSSAGPIPIRPPIVPVKTPTVPDSPGYMGPTRAGSEECVFYTDETASPLAPDLAKASPKRLSLPNTAWGSPSPEAAGYPGAGAEDEQQQLAANRHSLVEKLGELVAGAHALGEGQFPFPTALSATPTEETPTPPPAATSDPPAEDMLVAIRRGVRLRRTVTNDRSAPRIL
uniref:MTSS I-BAR domain containing 2 n=1 Tax=Macaca mulatta TaxID=9544 RepID=F6U0I0_MACMU